MDRFTIDYFRILDISLELAEVNAEGGGGGRGKGNWGESSNANEVKLFMNDTIRMSLHCKRNFPLNIPI